MAKVHAIASGYGEKWSTFCGMVGYKSGWANEFDTAVCDRFTAVPAGSRGELEVTCKACLKAISKTPKGNPSAAYFAGLG